MFRTDYSRCRLEIKSLRQTAWPWTAVAGSSCRWVRGIQCNDITDPQELTNNAISMWDSGRAWAPDRLVQDNKSLVWVDTMAMGEGGLWATSRGWPLDSQPKVVRVVEGEKCGGFCQIILT